MITIVSGLPRSGTSLLMQMLHAGGYPLLYDDERQANEDNPRGYFEYSPVRRIANDNSWVHRAEGRGLKVVSPLLSFLPSEFQYQVILVERDLEEVLKSQTLMLSRRGEVTTTQDSLMRQHFERHRKQLQEWLAQQLNFRSMTLHYADVVANPCHAAAELARFLAVELDLNRMAAIVDPNLYRQQST